MIRKLWKTIHCGLACILFLFHGGDTIAAPLIGGVLLLREPGTRGFLSIFDVMLGLLIVFTYSMIKKYPR